MPKPLSQKIPDQEIQERLVIDADQTQSDSNALVPGHTFDPNVGKILADRFEILDVIGCGGMGKVYKAKHLLLNRLVAYKVLNPCADEDKNTMRFQQEAKAATALNHPNIAAVREFGLDSEGRPYLVMDYIEGVSLAKLLSQEGRLASKRAIELITQLVEALNYAHKQGVIHRDVKPANIFITRTSDGEEHVHLIDFGIAKIFDSSSQDGSNLTLTGEVFGTPKYMSPEQCLGKTSDHRTDIYSLGCVFQEMLSGKAPFEADGHFEMLTKHVNDTPKVANQPDLDKIILRCLEKNPEDRYQSAALLLTDLASVQAERSITTIVPSRARTRAGLIAGSIASLLLVGVVLALLLNEDNWDKKMMYGVSLLIFFGSIINLLMNNARNGK